MLGRLNRRRQRAAGASCIDVARWIDELEKRLIGSEDRSDFLDALAILQRWQFDEMIDEPSRERAHQLVRRFASWSLVEQLSN